MQRRMALVVEPRIAAPEPDLRQPRAAAREMGKCAARISANKGPSSPASMVSKARARSAMTRVKTSMRPVELFQLAEAATSGGGVRLSISSAT